MPKRKVDTNPHRPVIQRIKCAAPYTDEWHPHDLVNRMAAGELNIQIAASWEISEATFYRWCREHEKLAEAYELGKTKYEAWFLKNRMEPLQTGVQTGKHAFNATAMLANTKLGYAKAQSQGGTQINIGQITVNQNATIQELKQDLIKDLTYLEDNRVIDVEIVDEDKLNQQDAQ